METKKYGWEPKNLPKERLFKGKYNIDHALTCEIGGFITRNDVVDVTVNFLSRVCRDFSKEPVLNWTPTSNNASNKSPGWYK